LTRTYRLKVPSTRATDCEWSPADGLAGELTSSPDEAEEVEARG